jgi:hexosaminidase
MKYLFILLISSILANAQVKTDALNLMPWPQTVNLTNGVFALNKNFKVNITGNPNPRIFARTTQFLRRLDGRTGLFFNQGFVTKINEFPTAQLQINCSQPGKIGINEDESYQLEIKSDKITINANSDLGAIHALETVLQLLQNNSNSYYFPTTTISDFPRFSTC